MRNSSKLTALTLITLLFGSLTAMPAKASSIVANENQIHQSTLAVGWEGEICYIDVDSTNHCYGRWGSYESKNALSIEAGGSTQCALLASEKLDCGGLGWIGTLTYAMDVSDAVSVSTGGGHVCVVTDKANVECWGNNDWGQSNPIGSNAVSPIHRFDFNDVVQVSTGGWFTCVLHANNRMDCFGHLGGTQVNLPVGVKGVMQMSSGPDDVCALMLDKSITCWGSSASPVVVNGPQTGQFIKVSVGVHDACAIDISGLAQCWGSDSPGQLTPPRGLTDLVDISVGGSIHLADPTACAVTKLNTIVCWGYDDAGAVASVQGKSVRQPKVNPYLPFDSTSLKLFYGLSEPTISGSTSPGSVLTAATSNWDSDVSLQWLRDGQPTGVTASSYTLGVSDLGSFISVSATYNKSGFDDLTLASSSVQVSTAVANTACVASIDKSAWLSTPVLQPTVSGPSTIGSIINGSNGSWSIGTKFCTYWFENGQAIPGAFNKTYKTQPTDIGQSIQFVVVGTDKSGKSGLRYSQPLTVTNAQFTSAQAPRVTGLTNVGSKLTASIAKPWSPGVNFSYQWLRDGQPIAGATASTYIPSPSDVGAVLSVQVCGSKQYYDNLCLTTSTGAPIMKGLISQAPAVRILGASTKVGSVLTGSTGNWPLGVNVSAQWLRDGSPISGEANVTHIVSQTDRGHTLSFQVTGTLTGYQDAVKVSTGRAIH
jgi:hypothetical protein